MWSSRTGKFGTHALGWLEHTAAAGLLAPLRALEPIAVLRALIEVKHNGDTTKLAVLMADPVIRQKWQAFASDRSCVIDRRDHEYAAELRQL